MKLFMFAVLDKLDIISNNDYFELSMNAVILKHDMSGKEWDD